MGKILVLYHSASGNTAKMAELVADGAGLIAGSEVRVREVVTQLRLERLLDRRVEELSAGEAVQFLLAWVLPVD